MHEVEEMLMLTKHVLICAKYSTCIASKNLEEAVGDCRGHLQPSTLDGVKNLIALGLWTSKRHNSYNRASKL